jgi:ubiquinone/menaquinone biosynthesis C-methylase UbiE
MLWPIVERLLVPSPGQSILDVACGNGVTSRRLEKSGAKITAIDFSAGLLALAKQRGAADGIDYRLINAGDASAIASLGLKVFDSALCNMALMEMAHIKPLLRAIPTLLKPGGSFVASILHPSFNNPAIVLTGERQHCDGVLVDSYSIRVKRYAESFTQPGVAMTGQPVPHLYFHRSIQTLLKPAFDAGLVLDGWDEPLFPQSLQPGLRWSQVTDIPPVLIFRLRVL